MRKRFLCAVGPALVVLPATAGAQSAAEQTAPDSIESAPSASEANARAVPAPSTTRVEPSAEPGEPDRVVTDIPGNLTPPPASAMNKEYPVCGGPVQDSCQNPGEGGAPGRSRALDHWPGEPASARSDG